MAQTKVQFQAYLSMFDFITQYGAEEQYRDAVFAQRWPEGLTRSTNPYGWQDVG